jgi:hypothetical protein
MVDFLVIQLEVHLNISLQHAYKHFYVCVTHYSRRSAHLYCGRVFEDGMGIHISVFVWGYNNDVQFRLL